MSTLSLPATEINRETSRRRHLGHEASLLVMNNWLKAGLVTVTGALLFVGVQLHRTGEIIAQFHPSVIRVNDIGRAERVYYREDNYQPQAKEIRYYLTRFVTQFYGRMRGRVYPDYFESLLFLNQPLASGFRADSDRTQWVKKLLQGQGEEYDIAVRQVTITDLRAAPYKADVDFQKVYYSSPGTESKRENYTAHFVFQFADSVGNDMEKYNPLGLVITYFHEDQAFTQ
jgi:type IV secretion system protein VirB5